MARATLTLEGARELEKALGQIRSAATRKNVARRALKAAAEPILSAFKGGTTVKTGTLVENEIMGTRLNRRQAKLHRAEKMPVEVHVGTSDPAGIQEEFGNRHQPAKGMLRAAWDSEGGETALGRVAEVLDEEIQAAAKRQARKGQRAMRKAAKG